MRLEANISLSKDQTLGTKVEVKNLNSFRSAERAIEYEIKRQAEILEKGEKISQETRGWDDKKQITFSQRSKEDSHDYRYFPDPDLPKLKLSEIEEFGEKVLRLQIKETPNEKRGRFKKDYGLKESDVNFYISNIALGNIFEKIASSLKKNDFQLLSNYVVSDLASLGEVAFSVNPESVATVVNMINSGELSSRGAKDIIQILVNEGGDPRVIADKEDLIQKSNEAELILVVKKVMEQNQKVVEEYKAGKLSAIQFLVGQCMKETKGSANPTILKDLILKAI
jgi:aspartyl-tRNA(Asn)/glutamyl-tRNA(Gln) amidotransferase subunit B